jgi:PAS domain S-box-containing protein
MRRRCKLIFVIDDNEGRSAPLSESVPESVSEAVLLSMIEFAPDGLMLVDSDGRIRRVNQQIEKLFGYTRGLLVGRPVEELLPEQFRQAHTSHRSHYREVPTVRLMGAGLDLRARRFDGSEFPVEISLSPIDSPDGQLVIAAVRDITDRVEAEARTTLIQATIDAAHDGVFMFRPDTLLFTYVNEGAVDQTGFERTELLSMGPLDIEPLFTKESLVAMLEPLLSGRVSSLDFRTIHRRKDGIAVPVEIILEYPQSTHDSLARVLVAVARDITDRDAFERQLLDSEAAFRRAFDDAPVGMLTARLEGTGERTLEQVNRAFCDLLGYTADELVGINIRNLSHPDDLARDDSVASQMQDSQVTQFTVEKRYRRKDGTYVWVFLQSKVIQHEFGVRVLAHVLDISDRKVAEAERERQRLWLQGVAEVRTTLFQDDDLGTTLTMIRDRTCELVDADVGLIASLDDVDGRLSVDSHRHQPQAQSPVANLGGFVDEESLAVLRSGRAAILNLPDHWCLAVPLPFDDTEKVLFFFRSKTRETFDEFEIRAADTFAQQGASALQLAAARRDRQRITLFEDRERIARDLHDVVIQRIFAAGLSLESLRAQVSPASAAAKIQQTVDQLDNAMRELRSTIFGLNSFEARIPIEKQIHDLVYAHHATLGFQPDVVLPEHIESVPLVVIEQLLPTVNEALSNVAKHAHATSVDVVIDLTDDELILAVTDNGKGIDADALRGKGLTNLERRALRLGGSARIEAPATGGTRLSWHVPI